MIDGFSLELMRTHAVSPAYFCTPHYRPHPGTGLSLPLFPAFKSFALLPFLLVAFVTVFVARSQNGKSSPLTASAALVAFKVCCSHEAIIQPSKAENYRPIMFTNRHLISTKKAKPKISVEYPNHFDGISVNSSRLIASHIFSLHPK